LQNFFGCVQLAREILDRIEAEIRTITNRDTFLMAMDWFMVMKEGVSLHFYLRGLVAFSFPERDHRYWLNEANIQGMKDMANTALYRIERLYRSFHRSVRSPRRRQ